MPYKSRAFDEKTKVTNFLNSHYLDESAGPELVRKRRIIRETVDEIFRLYYFPSIPESVTWYRKKIVQILEEMETKLYRAAPKPTPTSVV
jgi:hypothetical protein